jgi:hypothetical protein
MIYSNGYSYVRASERYEGFEDVIPSRPPPPGGTSNAFDGEELLINQGKLDALLQEVSVGFGWSRKISDNLGIGFSLFGAYRDQTKIRYESYQAFDTTYQRSATTDIYIDIDFWALRFYGKFGLSAEWEDLKIGITVTTPSIAFIGGGTDGASFTSNNVYASIDSSTNEVKPVDIIASDRQEGLTPKYKSPFSAAAGFEYRISEVTKIHFAFEWFAPLSSYVVLQPESHSFIRNIPTNTYSSNSADLLKVYDAMKSVFNFGTALEQKLTGKFTGYLAARTDFSNANYSEIEGLAVGFTDFDIYHFTVGTSFEMNNTFIGLGLEYSHGQRSDFKQIFNFPIGRIEPDDIVLASEREKTKAIYNNFNVFFGVTQLF